MTTNKQAKTQGPNTGSRARGFTLIEILVALAVLSLSLGVLMQIFSTGLGGARTTEARAMALRLAESKLAALGVEEPLVEGESSGRFEAPFDGRFRWRVLVRPQVPQSPEAQEGEENALLRAIAVEVSVFWDDKRTDGNERSISLSTIRLAPVE